MTLRCSHSMPFGAELRHDGGVCFRLWAPSAQRVDLVLYEAGGLIERAMPRLEEGWYQLHSGQATAGSRYAFRIDGGLIVPDPASRFNPDDVHGPSVVVDPLSFEWHDDSWRGLHWHEAVIYELHVGTFSPEGTFAGIERRLDHLVELGITVIELMPIADFPGTRGWGYDGVLLYAPDSAYGTPASLKSLIAAAHRRGIAVMLDVVYNHFGPQGNYLHRYAHDFFSTRHQTPWGAAINFDSDRSRTVRDFFVHNALYWLEEYRLDGLRFDATHAIRDASDPHIFVEIARAVRAGPGCERAIHLVLENRANEARYLGPPGMAHGFDAQWNDDSHHCLHVLATGESDGYYADFASRPRALLGRSLAEGFAYQGEPSLYAGGKQRGEPSAHLPPTAFVSFLQNHDQIGNRAGGERLCHLVGDPQTLLAVTAILLLSPSPPLLFMGEEWAASEAFLYFCDFEPELAAAVRAGRLREFARFERFRDPGAATGIPDPAAIETFRRACLDWTALQQGVHAAWLERYRQLLATRRRHIIPLVPMIRGAGYVQVEASDAFAVSWALADGRNLQLLANLSPRTAIARYPAGQTIFATHPKPGTKAPQELAPWSVTWLLQSS